MEYDSLGRMTCLDSPDRPARHWHYDAAGRIQRARVDDRDYEFQYDTSGAISRIIGPGGRNRSLRIRPRRKNDPPPGRRRGGDPDTRTASTDAWTALPMMTGSRVSFVYDALLRMTSRVG
jgi:YD repeat-containing protein